MKRGFTLIELLVVVGLMAMLGVAATGGYAALQRGMAERGAVSAVNTLLKAAKERAMVDRVPTVVFCYNRMIREADDDNNEIIVGEAVAVRRAGRISFVRGSKLYDEFADLGKTYDSSAVENEVADSGGMKLWRFDDVKPSEMQYSIVSDVVLRDDNMKVESFAASGSNYLMSVYAFLKKSGSNKFDPGNWCAGNGYGFEFATIQLPHNFIFQQKLPANLKDVQSAGVFYFDPLDSSSDEQVEIWYCRPNASGKQQPDHAAGKATSKAGVKS